MKKLINGPERVVEEMVEGLVMIDGRLSRIPGRTVVIRSDAAEVRARQVAVISGGGSGHEPAHAGYVGRGMLSAAVAGDVFTSPSPASVLAAIRAVTGAPGALLVVKNYTGDRLNFGLAAERARADGLNVAMVVVGDDVALAASGDHAGRRGLAGTIFVHKLAGAVAESGASLAEVAAEAQAAADAVRTMGVALSPCTVPAAGEPGFTLADDEIEFGLGIHGEPGVHRAKLERADALVDTMLAAILADRAERPGSASASQTVAPDGNRVVLMVNNLGATPAMELAIVARRAIAVLETHNLKVERAFVGTFLSALEMAGVSLTLLAVDDARLARLDAPTDASAWRPASPRGAIGKSVAAQSEPSPVNAKPSPPRTAAGQRLEKKIRAVVRASEDAAASLTELDRHVGDGDFGETLGRGARAVAQSLDSYPLDDPSATLRGLGETLEGVMGGTSGALYGVFFLRAGFRLGQGGAGDPSTWAAAFRAGCTGVADLGGASPGDRTALDALVPACDAFESAVATGRPLAEALNSAALAAEGGAHATAQMHPRRGRSSYLGDRALGYEDPGAAAVAIWLKAVASALHG
jgi:dihydroxyacetone kinase